MLSKVEKVFNWARSRSLWYFSTGAGCCADEMLQSYSCRYDIERFGMVPQSDPSQADLLIVSGFVSQKGLPELKEIYHRMADPKYVIALGACACGGGAFREEKSKTKVDLRDVFPIDVFVPGCPPRPEAIMNGLIALQEKISGNYKRTEITH